MATAEIGQRERPLEQVLAGRYAQRPQANCDVLVVVIRNQKQYHRTAGVDVDA